MFRQFATLLSAAILCTNAMVNAQGSTTEPVKIFILAGQSNMVGHGNMTPATAVNTLEHLVDPVNDTALAYQFLVDGDNWKIWDDVWIHYARTGGTVKGDLTTGFGTNSGHVGPEIGFGHMASEQYESQVLIIKCAWGGKSLGRDFLPPSAESYPTPQSDGDKGFYYAEILRLVSLVTSDLGTHFPGYAGQGYEIAGFGWHQGFNDRVNEDFSAAYETNMAHFIRDMRSADKGLDVPGLPFVIVTSAMDGNGPAAYTQVELAQRAMADPELTDPSQPNRYDDFIGNVAVVDARQTYKGLQFWYPVIESPVEQGFHWNRNAKTYVNIGLAMGDAMADLSPGRCPSRVRAAGVASGIELTWQNGLETPTSVQVKRDGVEIAAAAPVNPATFIDTTALPGIHTYELTFAMPGDPCDPLTVTFNGSINKLLAFRSPGGVGLTWENPMTYAGIEIRRDGELLEANLSGTATSFTDTAPPASGIVTYTVSPTTGTSTTASAEINLNGLPSGSAVIYEPFDYVVGELNGQSGISEVGLTNVWQANSTTLVTAGTLSYGSLPVGGGKLSDFNGGVNRFIGTRGINASALADQGLLNDGATLWFSVLLGYDAGGNRSNTRLAFILGDESQSTGNNNYYMNSPGATGLGVNLGGTTGHIRALLMTDQNTPSEFGTSPGAVLPTSNTNVDYALVVGRITWGATEDTIDLFLPGTDLALPASVHSTLTVDVDQSGYDTISFARGDKVVLDEIRFGATYESVIGADVDPDIDPPTPNPAGFGAAPAAVSDSAISMTAITGTDASGPVEYLFTETSGNLGGSSSAWQTSPSYTNEGLAPSTQYTYTVTMRDSLGNTGTASMPLSATTLAADNTPPSPNPMTWAVVPTAVSSSEITMTATTATDPSGVEYYFTCTSGGGNDSGWQDSPTYTDTGLNPSTTYAYTVTARDKSSNANETAASSPPAAATTDDAPSGPGSAVLYEPFDYPAGALDSASGGTGFSGNWSSNAATIVAASDLPYGDLPTSGNSIGNLAGGINRFGGARAVDLATPGLLANGSELWFSLIMGYDTGGNRTNSRLAFVLGSSSMATGNNQYRMGTTGATGLGVNFGRTSNTNGTIVATSMNDTNAAFGTGQGTIVVPNSDDNNNVDYRLVVGRITWGATEDTIDIFLPDTNLNLGPVHSTLTVDVDQSGYDTISFARGDKVVMDEIRFGASFESVIGLGAPGDNPYADWSGGEPADSDSNSDGVPNGIAWALGAPDPDANAINLLPTADSSDPDHFVFTFQRSDEAQADANTTITVEYGSDLSGWTTATDGVDGVNIDDSAIPEPGLRTVVVTIPKTLASGDKLFARLNVVVTTP